MPCSSASAVYALDRLLCDSAAAPAVEASSDQARGGCTHDGATYHAACRILDVLSHLGFTVLHSAESFKHHIGE